MKHLSLFTGGGLGELGLTHFLGWETLGYVEFNKYCQQVIAARIKDGYLHAAPIFSDIRAFNDQGYAGAYQGMVDVVSAGFPCQPFSSAGKKLGGADERNMWPETIRTIRTIRPEWCFFENVPGLLTGSHGYFGTILRDLAKSGFDVRWRCLSAAEMGAPHRRKRLWVVGHSNSFNRRIYSTREDRKQRRKDPRVRRYAIYEGNRKADSVCAAVPGQNLADSKSERAWRLSEGWRPERKGATDFDRNGEKVSDPDEQRLSNGGQSKEQESSTNGQKTTPQSEFERCSSSWWTVEPRLDRVVNGCPSRVDRIRAIGNGQVPQVAAKAWRLLTENSHKLPTK